MYHPVTTEYSIIGEKISSVVDAVLKSGKNYVVVYPNNDLGSEVILNEYKRFDNNERFRLFPSLRFEYFLTLLKNADYIIGNSSAGIRESGIYGVPAIDVGTRQSGRYSSGKNDNIQHVDENVEKILEAIKGTPNYKSSSFVFGKGNSTEKFMTIVQKPEFWSTEIQKHFVDRDM
jgi:UDP-N-acetylglucosamine 2-epimerase (hydrolysing)